MIEIRIYSFMLQGAEHIRWMVLRDGELLRHRFLTRSDAENYARRAARSA